MRTAVIIVGGGLAGCECAWQLAERGVLVELYEMRPHRSTPAHKTGDLAELVCSNSLRSDDPCHAAGLLKREMEGFGSLIIAAAREAAVPAGSALAVDRVRFATAVTGRLTDHPRIELRREEVRELPAGRDAVIATGPLTSPALSQAVMALTGEESLAFFDAIAPIVYRDSIDMSVAWFQSRYDKGGPDGGKDYINCPMDREQYHAFVAALLAGEATDFKDWERDTPYFEGCLPIEVMAARGPETLRHGPMKPVGLTNAHAPQSKPYAVVQLRQDNALGTLYNIVGFQTKLKHGEQKQVFRTIPGLREARFARLGGIHRNTFLNSPRLLDGTCRLKAAPWLRFAGQITGVEGYVESAAIGLLTGRFAAAERSGRRPAPPPPTTALGALLAHITGGAEAAGFQPMNVNFGLLPPLHGEIGRKERRRAIARRALADLDVWLGRAQAAAE